MMRRVWYVLPLIGVAAVLLSCRPVRVSADQDIQAAAVSPEVSEERLGAWPANNPRLPGSVVSPDGLHAAWVVRRSFGYAVAYDGRFGPRWDEIGGVLELDGCIGTRVCGRFSGDSRHFAYWGRRGGLWYLIVDGRPGPGCPGDQGSAPSLIGPVNGHYAIPVQRQGQAYWIIDGREQPHYLSLCQFQFSQDGQHYAYVAGTKDGFVIIRDGRVIYPNSSFGSPSHVTFSPDGKRLAYVTSTGAPQSGSPPNTPQIIVEGEASWVGHASGEVVALDFSPDSRSLVWVEVSRAAKTDQIWVSSSWGPQPSYPRVKYLSFDPDGRGLTYVGYKADGSAELIYIGTVMARGEDIAPVRPIGADGLARMRIATDAFTGWSKDCPSYVVKHQGWWHLIEPFWEGRAEKAIAEVSTEFPAYLAERADGKWVMVRDNLPHGPVFDSHTSPLVFSLHGRRVAYSVLVGEARAVGDRAHVVVDDELGPAMRMVSTPAFSPNGEHVAYFARSQGQWRALVNGVEGPAYDEILGRKQPVFGRNGLEYLAVRAGKLYRVTHRLQ